MGSNRSRSTRSSPTKIERAIDLFGAERVLLHPDCGFATFADNPICNASSAEAKLSVIAQALERVQARL